MTTFTTTTARRIVYWLSLVVVILIATQTILDALGVTLIPRRSWSEGISPKVIQVPGQALYHEYIALKREDLKIELPEGVQTSFLGLAAIVHPTTPAAKALLRLMTVPEDLFFLGIAWLLRSMVLMAWGNPTGAITPFIRVNVVRLRWIAVLFGALWVYHLFLPQLIEEVSFYTTLNNFGPVIGEDPPWFLTNGSLGIALLLLILAEVFSRGVRLEKDVEGLV
jgi:hypothetical protein